MFGTDPPHDGRIQLQVFAICTVMYDRGKWRDVVEEDKTFNI